MISTTRLRPACIGWAGAVCAAAFSVQARAIPVPGRGEMVVPANAGRQRPPLSHDAGAFRPTVGATSGVPGGTLPKPILPPASAPSFPARLRRSLPIPRHSAILQPKGRPGITLVLSASLPMFETLRSEFARTSVRWGAGGPATASGVVGKRRLTLACVPSAGDPGGKRLRSLLEQVRPEYVVVTGTGGSLDPRVPPGAVVLGERVGRSGSPRNAWLLADRPLLLEGRRIAARLRDSLDEDLSAMTFTGALLAQPRQGISRPAFSAATYRLVASDREVAALAETCGGAAFPILPIVGISHRSDSGGAVGGAPRFAAVAADRAARFTALLLQQLR